MGFWDKLFSKKHKRDVTPVADATPAPTALEEPKQPIGPIRIDAPISDPRLDVFDREPFARRIADIHKPSILFCSLPCSSSSRKNAR